MKRSFLPVLLVVSCFNFSNVFAQVGIGTASPNQKAVLELKSPGNNQGFLVPRLTTAQRTGMSGLSSSEKGLLVFDSDISKFYYWSGSVWIIIEDSTGTDSQTLSFNPSTGLLSISGGNNITVAGISPGGGAGGDLTGTYPNPTVTNDAITSAKLQSDATTDANRAVTTNHIRDNAIVSAKISDGTIATNDLADGSVTSAKVLDGAIANADINASASIAVTKFAAGTNGQVLLTSGTTPTWSSMPPPSGTAGGDLTGTYPNPTVANNAIISAKILDGTIATIDILDGAISTAKIADAAVNTLKLLDNAVNSTKILDGTIVSVDILDGAIATVDILDGAISTIKIADNGVTTAKILDGTLVTADLANGAITSAKILDGDIATADLANGAITSAKVLDATLATADIADGAITSAKVLDGDLATADLANGAVTSAKVLDATLATADIADGAITSAKVLDGTLATADIANTAITDAKIATGVDVAKLTAAPTTGFVLTTVLGNVTWAALPVFGLGTVTSVATGTGLTGGPITTSGTISIAANGVTSTELQSDAVVNTNRAVNTNHIRDAAVNSAKILDASIVNADISAVAAVAVSKLAASSNNGDVLTTVAGAPTWQAPADNSATNEIQKLSEVLTAGNNAGALDAINFSSVSIGRSDTPGALNVTGSHYSGFTLLGSVATYAVVPTDYLIIGTNTGSVITTVNLPAGNTSIGRVLTIRGRSIGSASIAGVRVQAASGETIDDVNLAPYTLTPTNGNFISVTILKITASEWITIARSPF